MNYYNFYRSSIGRKLIMAITGIFLIIFLLLHLSVNIFLFFGEEHFNKAVFFMRKNLFIKIMEYILFIGFVIHILSGIKLHIYNSKSKGKKNFITSFTSTTFSSRSMIYSGILILCFLILHLINFSIPMKKYENISPYNLVTSLFKNPFYTFIYIFFFLILGIHLHHGFHSSFQSLGLLNKQRAILIQRIGTFYLWFICIGFSSIAIWFFFK